MGTIYFKIIFWAIALAGSIFYASWAFKIHMVDKTLVDQERNNDNRPWFIHQWLFNFIGAITGWIILWILLPNIINGLCFNHFDSFKFTDVLLLIIALLGITGHLPMTLYGIAKSAFEFANKLSK